MKLTDSQKEDLKKRFIEIKEKQELVSLINDCRNLLYGSVDYPTEWSDIIQFAHPTKRLRNAYKKFIIKKKNGGNRTIYAPNSKLKHILHALNLMLKSVIEPHEAATGFVNGKSIVDNAKIHLNKQFIYNIDLKDFFHSFNHQSIIRVLANRVFKNSKRKIELSVIIGFLCTTDLEIDGKLLKKVLPQGSPTSPILTNLLCERLDRRLSGLAKRFSAKYTRYADDITFSCNRNIFKESDLNKLNEFGKHNHFINELNRLLAVEKLHINPKKTRLQKNGYKKEVTGLTVNEKVNVDRSYVKELRKWIYLWETYGLEKASNHFKNDYLISKAHSKKNKNPNLINVLGGKLDYLKMVKGANDTTYIRLQSRFSKLLKEKDPMDQVFSVWQTAGLESAMRHYYANQT